MKVNIYVKVLVCFFVNRFMYVGTRDATNIREENNKFDL